MQRGDEVASGAGTEVTDGGVRGWMRCRNQLTISGQFKEEKGHGDKDAKDYKGQPRQPPTRPPVPASIPPPRH